MCACWHRSCESVQKDAPLARGVGEPGQRGEARLQRVAHGEHHRGAARLGIRREHARDVQLTQRLAQVRVHLAQRALPARLDLLLPAQLLGEEVKVRSRERIPQVLSRRVDDVPAQVRAQRRRAEQYRLAVFEQ